MSFSTHSLESQVYCVCCFLGGGGSDTELLLCSLPIQSAAFSPLPGLIRTAHPKLASETPATSVSNVYIILD